MIHSSHMLFVNFDSHKNLKINYFIKKYFWSTRNITNFVAKRVLCAPDSTSDLEVSQPPNKTVLCH